MFADGTGESRIQRLELPELPAAGAMPARRGLQDVPTTTLMMSELHGPKPDSGLHPAPRRQLVIVLHGAIEVSTPSGDAQRLGPGDILLADDVDSAGHHTREVGEDRLATITVGLPADWDWPHP